MTYLEKAEKIGEDEREFVREELALLAEWMRKRYTNINWGDLRRYLHQMLDIAV